MTKVIKTCEIYGCVNPFFSKGKCKSCYNKKYREENLEASRMYNKKWYKEKHSLYTTWKSMKTRCFNEKHEAFGNYGGRGITVCDRWVKSFDYFLKDMGEKPSDNHTLDRIDVNGNYEPKNCKWSTWVEQNNNKRL